ncbi:MAG: heme-copper oxidase subunit III [Acidimicrobiales bacterium]|nr:heme-copper oxidase subunit III [Acidimicrobiales bacterium]
MTEVGVAAEVRPNRAPDATSVGMVVWLSSELMFFAGLFAGWFMVRSEAKVFPPPGVHLPVGRTAIATAVLLASSATIHVAVGAAKRSDRVSAVRWLIVTALLGMVFLAFQAYEYATAEFHIDTNAYGSMFYLLTGFHGLHVLGGVLFLLATAGIIVGRSRAPAGRTVEIAAYYWHFVDAVWVAMFLTVYVVS